MTESIQDKGLLAFEQGNYEVAFEEWLKLAEQQHPQACHNLAMLYESGMGVEENRDLAQMWCEKAAHLGLPSAQHHLGYFLWDTDAIAALDTWEQAAQAGVAAAQFELAMQYVQGEVIEQDNDAAADWFEAAAVQGHVEAQFQLGVLYANAQQYANAQSWWEKAAESGHENAQFNLTRLKEMGLSV